jgi:hypothetical protein
MALSRFPSMESRKWEMSSLYYLDLIQHRNISLNLIAQDLNITNRPSFVVENGNVLYTASHSAIYFDDLVGKASYQLRIMNGLRIMDYDYYKFCSKRDYVIH